MQDMRKELIKLLCGCPCESDIEEGLGCPYRKHGMCNEVFKLDYCAVSHLADHLISNGVTIQKWIPAEQPPHFTPNRWRRVLVTVEDKDGKRFTTVAKYNEEWKQWEQFNDIRFFDSRHFKVVAWMPKPEPMKEG